MFINNIINNNPYIFIDILYNYLSYKKLFYFIMSCKSLYKSKYCYKNMKKFILNIKSNIKRILLPNG